MASTTIEQWLATAIPRLRAAGIHSARLDCLILLEHTLNQDRTWLLTHPNHPLQGRFLQTLEILCNRRIAREPVAYILGTKEFYRRDFITTPEVLIPRPETEIGIELLKKYLRPQGRLLDTGTGSGCIAITASLELPDTRVEACDISQQALEIAHRNLEKHGGQVHFFTSNLLSQASGTYDAIIANLPYVDSAWQRSPETDFEPRLALFEKDNGQALIKQLLAQAPSYLTNAGYLLLEADPRQHEGLLEIGATHDLHHIETNDFWIVFTKQLAASH